MASEQPTEHSAPPADTREGHPAPNTEEASGQSKRHFRSWYRRRRTRARVTSTGLTPPSYLVSILAAGSGMLLFLSGVLMMIFGFTSDSDSRTASTGFLKFGGATFGAVGFFILMAGCKYFMIVHARHEGAQNRMYEQEHNVVPGQSHDIGVRSMSEWARNNQSPEHTQEQQHKIQNMFKASGVETESTPETVQINGHSITQESGQPRNPGQGRSGQNSLILPGKSAAGIGVPTMFQASLVGRGEVGATFEMKLKRPSQDNLSIHSDTPDNDAGSMTNIFHVAEQSRRPSVPSHLSRSQPESHTPPARGTGKQVSMVFTKNSVYSRHDLDLDKSSANEDSIFTVTKSFKPHDRRHSTDMFLASSYSKSYQKQGYQ